MKYKYCTIGTFKYKKVRAIYNIILFEKFVLLQNQSNHKILIYIKPNKNIH